MTAERAPLAGLTPLKRFLFGPSFSLAKSLNSKRRNTAAEPHPCFFKRRHLLRAAIQALSVPQRLKAGIFSM